MTGPTGGGHSAVFTAIPHDLYRRVEPEAGDLLPALTGRYRSSRPREQWQPHWSYLLSGLASTEAVVAGLCCGSADVPEHAWDAVLRRYCPVAWALLTAAGVSFDEWNTGRLDAVLTSRIAAQANRELGGYAVFAVLDVPAVTAEVVAAFGAVPEFIDEERS